MNYSMQGMTKTILKVFQEKGEGKERELQVEWQASCHSREEAQSWTKAWNWVIILQRKWSLEAEMPWIFGG